jgi:protein ImuB
MAFASIYVPNFMAQAALRAEPLEKGIGAIALIEGKPPVWKVVAANESALRAGVALGMTKLQAMQFAGVEIRQRSAAQEQSAHAALLDLGWSVSPRVEDTAADTIVIDIAGLAGLIGTEETIAQLLTERAIRLGLHANIAISANLETAIRASCGFRGITIIPEGEEAQRLGPLPVNALAPGEETLETFSRWGIRDCAALAALPVLELSTRLGQEGVRLHELARGGAGRAMVLAESNSTFVEEQELDDAVSELEPLAFVLNQLLMRLVERIAMHSLGISTVRLRFELEPSFEAGLQVRDDGTRRKTAPIFYEKTLALPLATRNSAMLLNLLRLQLQNDPPAAPVPKISLTAEPSQRRAMQGGLFRPISPDPEKLELMLARLLNLVGEENAGTPVLANTHRPGEFRIEHFAAPQEEEGRRKRCESALAAARAEVGELAASPAIAFRAFRPPAAARVSLREGIPARVAFCGMRGEVLFASGPWRTSGDWWREDGWHCDEWDLEIRFAAQRSDSDTKSPALADRVIYRFCYDRHLDSWFVRGSYD